MPDRLFDLLEGWDGLILALIAASWLLPWLRRALRREDRPHDSESPIEPR